MSMDDLTAALALIDRHPERCRFMGERPEDLVRNAETALGLSFPPDYRAFVRRYGAGNFSAAEFYGVTRDDFVDGSVPNGIWLTLDERRSGLPGDLVVVGSTGTGEYFCLKVGASRSPVVVVSTGKPRAIVEEVAPDFGAFLLAQIRNELDA